MTKTEDDLLSFVEQLGPDTKEYQAPVWQAIRQIRRLRAELDDLTKICISVLRHIDGAPAQLLEAAIQRATDQLYQ